MQLRHHLLFLLFLLMLLKRWCNLAEVDKFLFLDDIVELVAAALDIVHHGASGQGLATYWQVQILIEMLHWDRR